MIMSKPDLDFDSWLTWVFEVYTPSQRRLFFVAFYGLYGAIEMWESIKRESE